MPYLNFCRFSYYIRAFVRERSPALPLTSYVTLSRSLNPFKALVSTATENWIVVRINSDNLCKAISIMPSAK